MRNSFVGGWAWSFFCLVEVLFCFGLGELVFFRWSGCDLLLARCVFFVVGLVCVVSYRWSVWVFVSCVGRCAFCVGPVRG